MSKNGHQKVVLIKSQFFSGVNLAWKFKTLYIPTYMPFEMEKVKKYFGLYFHVFSFLLSILP